MHGRETGQWHEADLAVAHWLQHTSRDGDMQLHVHSQIAHVARTGTDGKWRAPDSLGYNEHVGAVAAIVSQHLEEALTRRFGVEWTARDDGHGFEIKGISGEMMRVFSSRRESITADLRERAARFEQRYGRKPSQRELAQLAQASNFKTRANKSGALDFAQLHAGWADKLTRTLGVSLASVAPSVWHHSSSAGARPRGPNDPGPVPSQLEVSHAAQKAIALAQQEKSTWTRADLIKYLGRVLPRSGMDPAAAAALLEDLADRTLRSEFEPVACLQAPEPAEVPASLLRADGRSIYQRHGGVRYATHAQLSLEERMLALARGAGAPRMTRADAARALGADLAQLEAALAGRAHDAPGPRTRTGLREDQAAAALSVLTDGRRVSVINAPAGSGKTWVLAAAGKAWAAAGLGRVIGITPSQSARNTLAAGVPESYNSAQFLGHLPGHRGARGPVRLRPGDLVLMDEASMVSNPDLADVIGQAAADGAKVILAGDTQQLQAVENGGGMSLLADALGYVRLAEPVRFRAAWEQAASLRLRSGDASVLAEYDQHGRIRGGEPEQMMDAAAAAYLALTLDGTDTLLMAADHALRRELSRRIRDDLIRLGVVQPGPAVRIAGGATASAGDLIICTQNDHTVAGGGARPQAGQRRPAPHRGRHRRRADRPPRAGRRPAHRAAALDGPALPVRQLRQCRAGLRGHRPRRAGPHRDRRPGRDHRHRGPPARLRRPDPRHHHQPGLRVHRVPQARRPRPRPPPRARTGPLRPDPYRTSRRPRPGHPARPARRTAGRALRGPGTDGQLLSASQDRHRALTDADHLAILNAIWTAETAAAREQRYHDLLVTSLPPGYRQEPSHRAKWLWRTMRAAELAGLDAGGVLAAAIAERDLAGARDLASVINDRLRHRTGSLIPLPAGPWSAQVPAIADPGRRAYAAEIAAMMDARKDRIGEHAVGHAPPWAITALGPVPGHPLDRLDWQRRASSIGAYRELSGYDHPTEPIGPEPVAAAPDMRAAWHEAFAALGPVDGPDVRGIPDGSLLHLRDTYPLETAWAPQWVGDELRQVRTGAQEARLAAVRAAAEAEAAQCRGHDEEADRQQALAASYQAMHDAYAEREATFAAVMADRADWDAATRAQRHLAVAADAELRRRHPGQQYPPLRSAEPPPVTPAQRDDLTLTTGEQIRETGQWIKDLTAQRRAFAARLADRQSLAIPSEDPDYGDLGQAFPPWPAPARDAILQPPKPEIPPSARILERAPDHDPDMEAAT